MITLYAVFRQGIYRHECGGIFSVQEKAEGCARTLIEAEFDAYHKYEVVPFEMNKCPVTADGQRFKIFEEAKPVLTLVRGFDNEIKEIR